MRWCGVQMSDRCAHLPTGASNGGDNRMLALTVYPTYLRQRKASALLASGARRREDGSPTGRDDGACARGSVHDSRPL
jgi:hypothetical protein